MRSEAVMRAATRTDADLIAGTAAGDADAFALLYRTYAPRIEGWLRVRTSCTDAGELTQEVMVRVWRGASRYDAARGAVSTWIFTIARNTMVDSARAQRCKVDAQDPCFVADPAPSPESKIDGARTRVAVAAAVGALPKDQQEVIRLVYFVGMTLHEASQVTNACLGTTKSRIRLACERLRRDLVELRGGAVAPRCTAAPDPLLRGRAELLSSDTRN